MPHVIDNQAEKYTQDLHYNILKHWVDHNTPSEYTDRDVWMKAMMHFKTICGSNFFNAQVLLYYDHGSHFDDRYIHMIQSNHIKPSILKGSDSGNDHPNDNGPNLKLKGLYGQAIMNCQRQHENLNFINYHMNYKLVETWRYFKL